MKKVNLCAFCEHVGSIRTAIMLFKNYAGAILYFHRIKTRCNSCGVESVETVTCETIKIMIEMDTVPPNYDSFL